MGSEYLVNVSAAWPCGGSVRLPEVFAVAGLKVPGDAAGMPNPYVEVDCLGEKKTTQAPPMKNE